MILQLDEIISESECYIDRNGIIVSKYAISDDLKTSMQAWERIYNFDLEELERDRVAFDRDKLADHVKYIKSCYKFFSDTKYLEIGCGPAHIGEYLIKTYDLTFIGVDFNYEILISLKNYFEKKGYKKFILIHADINRMPLLKDSVDFIYGGGVIEHFPDTNHILSELFRVLKPGGCSFNTVPGFSLWWLLRFYNNIPSWPILRKLFEYLHIKIFQGKILEKNFGYELSFTMGELEKLHKKNYFINITKGPFAFHPSMEKLKIGFLRKFFFELNKINLTAAFYFVCGYKPKDPERVL